MLSDRCGVTILPSSATRRGSGRLGMSRMRIDALILPPCEGGREPKANGGFGFLAFQNQKTKPPARKIRSLPPCQGGGKKTSCSLPLLPLLQQFVQSRVNPASVAFKNLVAVLL